MRRTLMERPASGRSATDLHIEKARAGLREMNAWAAANGSPAGTPQSGIYGAAVTVMNELTAALRLLAPVGEEPRVGCPFCHRMVAPASARCGFCWKRIGGLGQ